MPNTMDGRDHYPHYVKRIWDKVKSWTPGATAVDISEIRDRVLDHEFVIDPCEATAGWNTYGAIGGFAATDNHVRGTHALTFNKVAGGLTVMIHKDISPTINAEEYKDHYLLGCVLYLSSVANVDYVFIRVGTDSTDYSEWRVDSSDLTAGRWNSVKLSLVNQEPNVTGTGLKLSYVDWVAFGVVFNANANTLTDIRVDHLAFHSCRHSTAQLNAEISTEISSPNINTARVANTPTAVDHGVSDAGTQRTAANIIDNQNGVTGGAGATDAATQRTNTATDSPDVVALEIMDDWDEADRAKVNPIVGQAGVTADHGVSDAATPRVAANIIDNQNGVTGGEGASGAATQRVWANVIAGQSGVAADHGVSDAQTPRVAANIIDNQNGVTPDEGASDAATVRVWSNIIAGQSGVAADHGVSDAQTPRVAANIIDNQNGVSADHGVSDAATPRVAANIIDDQNGVTADHGVSDAGTPRVAANIIDDQNGVSADAGASDAATQRTVTATDSPDVTALEIIDDWDATHDDTHADDGPQTMLDYNAIPGAVGDTDAVRQQADAHGHAENAEYSRPLGSAQVVEQAPVEYDSLPVTARASAALGAGYDAAPIETPTGGRAWVLYTIGYTRGAANGSIRVKIERCTTVGGTDIWPQTTLISSGGVVPGADTTSTMQEEEFDFQSTGAAIDYYDLAIPTYGCHKLRISARESSGLAVGTAVIYGMLSNSH